MFQAIQFLEENGKNYGIRHTKRLNVIGPFHSEAMRPAVEPLRTALKYCNLEAPKVRVYSGVNAERYYTPRDIISMLPKQVI